MNATDSGLHVFLHSVVIHVTFIEERYSLELDGVILVRIFSDEILISTLLPAGRLHDN